MNADEELPGLEDWASITPWEAGALFRDYPGDWCIAGGWALDLYAGRQTRDHGDVDVQIDRHDLPHLHASLPGWLLYAAHGDLTPWAAGTPLPSGAHDIWCRRPGEPWAYQLMAGEFTEREWVYRRNARIRGPRDAMSLWIDGLPVIAPDIQLLYKSKDPGRARNAHDFALVAPLLSKARRAWLATCLVTLYGEHPWLPALRGTPG